MAELRLEFFLPGESAAKEGPTPFNEEHPAAEGRANATPISPKTSPLKVTPGDLTDTTVGTPDGQEWLVVSWNSGGFKKSQELICSHYGSLATYLHRMQAAVLCVQETKILPSVIGNEQDARKHGAVIDGFQSFWAFNELKGKPSGFNGVATWVKNDLADLVQGGVSATQHVLRDTLDAEGRCLLVELGNVVILNVYLPHVQPLVEDSELSIEEQQRQRAPLLEKKLRMLTLLRRRIDELEQAGRHVLMCGDLNLTWRAVDCAVNRCFVRISSGSIVGRSDVRIDAGDAEWMQIGNVVRMLAITCSAPSEHVLAKLPFLSDGLIVTTPFRVGGKEITPGLTLLTVNGAAVATYSDVKEQVQIDITAQLEFGVRPSDLVGVSVPSHLHQEPACVEYLSNMLAPPPAGCGLVDTFPNVHPDALDRFTCWNQSLNQRYSNLGARLDYVLCSASLGKLLVATPTEMLAGAGGVGGYDAKTRSAALCAATNFGGWREAPRKAAFGDEAGLSLQQDDMRLNDSQFRSPHTGLLYTPPSYSDHVPACALMRGGMELFTAVPISLVAGQKETRKSMPWKAQPSLASFFGHGVKRSRVA